MEKMEKQPKKANHCVSVALMDRQGNTVNYYSKRQAARSIGTTEETINRLLKTGKYGRKGYAVIALTPNPAL